MCKKLFTILILTCCFVGLSYGQTIRIEESATLTTGYCGANGTRQSSYAGADNGYYINISNSIGNGINWKVSVPASGSYSLKWRYSNGPSSAGTAAKVLVNGAIAAANVAFPKTNAWTTWVTTTATVNLSAGINTIRLETIAGNEFINVDWIEVTGNMPTPASCSGTTPVNYTLSVSSNPSAGGSVSQSPTGNSFASGTAVTLTATPASGYKFDGWSGGITSTSATATITMTGNKTVTANFSPISISQYTLTTTVTGSGSIGLSPAGGVYNSGTVVTLTATPATGYKFDGWSGGASGSSTTAIITMTASKTVTATFSPISVSQYTLTTTVVGSGSIGLSPVGGVYNSGTVVTLTATPATGYKFDGWSGAATGTSATASVTMTASKTVTATFSPIAVSQYTLTTTVSGSGSIGLSPIGGVYNSGTVVTLTATPAAGFKFTGWSGAATGTSSTTAVTMTANKSVTASFTPTTPPIPSEVIGFASLNGGTIGGKGGASRTISTLADLQSWVSSREGNSTPEVVYISGKISSSSTIVLTIKNGANVSVLGLGSTAEFLNVGLYFRQYKNVVVRNLKIHEVFYPNDGLTIDECQNVWVDHCELHSKIGPGITVDTYDGLLDIKKGSKNVTVSWCHLHHHMKTVLMGHTDSESQQAQDSQIRATFHHNLFESTNGRNPSLRFGAVHLFNNYFKNIDDYGAAIRQGAHALIENNVYENVKTPIATNKFDGPAGFACERGNIFPGSGPNSITQTGCDWWNSTNLPYTYTLDPVGSVPTNVPANVGVGKIDVSAQRAIASAEETDLSTLKIYQNYPNPAEGSTTIGVWLQEAGRVTIDLYSTTGGKAAAIADQNMDKGYNEVKFETSGLRSGIYIYEVQTAQGLQKKQLLIK